MKCVIALPLPQTDLKIKSPTNSGDNGYIDIYTLCSKLTMFFGDIR